MPLNCASCGSPLEKEVIVCPVCDSENGSKGVLGSIRHKQREFFVGRRLPPGDDEKYEQAFQKKLEFEKAKLSLGLAIAVPILGFFVVVAILYAFK